jgi:DNA polymerase V
VLVIVIEGRSGERLVGVNEASPWLLKKLYQPEVYYQKAGVMLSELVRKEASRQTASRTHPAAIKQAGR